MTWRRHCAGAEDTRTAGAQLAALLAPGDIVLLSGPLGAGKTTLVQGIARGLGVIERVTSPTFQMVREHQCHNDRGISTLHHADVYRITSVDEVWDLALGELVEEAGVAVVEWGELAASLFGRDVLSVALAVDGDEGRTLEVGGGLSLARRDELARWSGQ